MSITAEPVPVEVTLRGSVEDFAAAYARVKLSSALSVAPGEVIAGHVVLVHRRDPAVRSHAVAEASAQVGGQLLRARSAAPTMTEAIDDLEYRLRRQLVQLRDRSRTRHRWTGVATGHEWRHGDRPRQRMPWYPRPAWTREVVKRKSFASAPMSVDEAAYEMDLLDHDFFLYRDSGSGRPALVHRLPGGGYGVQGVEPRGQAVTVTAEPPPPRMTEAEARARLEADQEPFVFYVDADTGEGRVLYHRFDGHYGLIRLAG